MEQSSRICVGLTSDTLDLSSVWTVAECWYLIAGLSILVLRGVNARGTAKGTVGELPVELAEQVACEGEAVPAFHAMQSPNGCTLGTSVVTGESWIW